MSVSNLKNGIDLAQGLSLIPLCGSVSAIIAISLKILNNAGVQFSESLTKSLKRHTFIALIGYAIPVFGTFFGLAMIIKNCLAPKELVATEFTKDGMPIMDRRAAALLYKMQKEFDEVCQKHNITYAGCSGTSLGALRQNPSGIIPWDDDIDLVMPLNEQDKFTPEFHKELLEKGLKLRPHWGGFKITLLECPAEFGTKYGEGSSRGEFYWPFIDLFITYRNPDDNRLYINCIGCPGRPLGAPSTVWPKESWTDEELTNVSRVPFGPITIPIAHGAREYCERAYGKDCVETGYQIFDHQSGKLFANPKKIKITDFSPCPYDEELYKKPLPQALIK